MVIIHGIIFSPSLYIEIKMSNDMILLNMILVSLKKTWEQITKISYVIITLCVGVVEYYIDTGIYVLLLVIL